MRRGALFVDSWAWVAMAVKNDPAHHRAAALRREAHAASFDYDLKRIVADLQRQEGESGTIVVHGRPRKPTTVKRPGR